jgi:Flp pilus assembly pilin Flp
MRAFLALVQSFKTDQRGAFAVIFGIIAIVLVATAGAVVDFTTIEQARARAQDALDSAALGLQPKIFLTGETEATILEDAENLLLERLSGEPLTSAEVDNVDINIADGTLRIEANIVVPMSFVSLVGVNTIRARVVSEATRKRLAVEVAFVLDNSGSMSNENRMTNLKAATRCAMNVLFQCRVDGHDRHLADLERQLRR